MLLELGGLILSSAIKEVVADNDAERKRLVAEREKEAEILRSQQIKAENDAARKHETTMAVLGIVGAFVLAAANAKQES